MDTRRPLRRLRATLLLLALAAAVGACASLDPLQREAAFEESHKKFNRYLRFGRFSEASRFVVPELRSDFLALAPQIDDLEFTDYEVVHTDLEDDLSRAVVDVRISGYRLSHPVERSHVLTQTWRRDGGSWHVQMDLAALVQAIAPGAR